MTAIVGGIASGRGRSKKEKEKRGKSNEAKGFSETLIARIGKVPCVRFSFSIYINSWTFLPDYGLSFIRKTPVM